MPLSQPLAEFRQQLEAQLRDNQLPEALNALLQQLPEGSEKYRIVSAFITRLNAANKERFRNTITLDEYQRRIDQVSADFFDLLGDVTEADFDASSKTSVQGKNAKQGTVLYKVPHTMPLQKPTRCIIRVAVEEEAILDNIMLDKDVKTKSQVEISDVMSAELIDPEDGTFRISALNARTQLVRDTGYTEWIFNVTPLIEGLHQLLVKVSIMEIVPGFAEPIPREISVLESVTIVTEAPAPSDVEGPVFKTNGQSFAFQSSASVAGAYEVNYKEATETIPRQREGSGLRAMAIFLAFIVLAPAATWAFAPEIPDWVYARYIQDTPEAYTKFIEKFPKSPRREKAYFYKAEASGQLSDLRVYQDSFPSGNFENQVLVKIGALENKAVESIRSQPEAVKIHQFVVDFPESERLPEIKQSVENRAELLPVVENAYVASIQSAPTDTKVRAYLRDFPQQQRLNEVAEAVAAHPEVLAKAQPALDAAITQKVAAATTADEVRKVLPALEKAGSAAAAAKVEKLVEQKPLQIRKQVQQEVQHAVERVKAGRGSTLAPESSSTVPPDSGTSSDRVTSSDPVTTDGSAKIPAGTSTTGNETSNNAAATNTPVTTPVSTALPADNTSTKSTLTEPKTTRTRRSGIYDLVRVEGGTYTMGSPENEEYRGKDECQHSVTVRTFSLGQYKVTQADWREIMSVDPPKLEFEGCDDCPVENVSWDDIHGFLKKLNTKHPGKNYRLPTEEEWEYAARGGNKSKGYRYSGSNDLEKVAWYSDNSGNKTHRVGDQTANELGIYDMSGNVLEWCQNLYGPYPGCSGDAGSYRVLRGGSWNFDAQGCRVAYRHYYAPGIRNFNIGFRLASSPQ